MPIIRKQLKPSDVYPENIRYNPDTDTVQSLVNGDWVDNPDADPRKQTTFPPRITSSPDCDAAQSVSDAIKNQIDQTIDAVNNAKTAFTIAGLILGLFTFGVFDIFVAIALAIANAMIDAGGTALAAALSPSTFDTFTCILACHFTTGGRLEEGGIAAIEADVSEQIGGLGATILNAIVSLAGEGGINNLAAIGTSTGDCSDCDTCGCGFTTSSAFGNWDKWDLLDEELFDWSGIELAFNTDNATKMFATGYYTTPNQVLSAMTEFDTPCHVDVVNLYNTGTSEVQRMVAGYRMGGTWTTVLNEVALSHSGGTPWTMTLGFDVDAIGFQYLGNFAEVTAVGIA